MSSTTINSSSRNIERMVEFAPTTVIPRLPSHQPRLLLYPNTAAGRLLRREDEREEERRWRNLDGGERVDGDIVMEKVGADSSISSITRVIPILCNHQPLILPYSNNAAGRYQRRIDERNNRREVDENGKGLVEGHGVGEKEYVLIAGLGTEFLSLILCFWLLSTRR